MTAHDLTRPHTTSHSPPPPPPPPPSSCCASTIWYFDVTRTLGNGKFNSCGGKRTVFDYHLQQSEKNKMHNFVPLSTLLVSTRHFVAIHHCITLHHKTISMKCVVQSYCWRLESARPLGTEPLLTGCKWL